MIPAKPLDRAISNIKYRLGKYYVRMGLTPSPHRDPCVLNEWSLIPQNKNVCQLVWHLLHVCIAREDSGLHCHNKEGDRNSAISQASCRMDVTRRKAYLHQSKCTAMEKCYKTSQ